MSDFSDEEGAIQLDGVKIPHLDIDALLRLESGSLRPRDQIDVEMLTRLKSGKYGPQP